MIEKVDTKTILDVIAVIGWGAGLIVILRAAVRALMGYTKPKTPEDQQLAANLQGDLLKAIADQWKETNDQLHSLQTRLAVLETRQQGIEAELKRRS